MCNLQKLMEEDEQLAGLIKEGYNLEEEGKNLLRLTNGNKTIIYDIRDKNILTRYCIDKLGEKKIV